MADYIGTHSGAEIDTLADWVSKASSGISGTDINAFLLKIMNCKIKIGTKKCTTEHSFSTGIDLSEYSKPCIFASITTESSRTPTEPSIVFTYEGGTSGTILYLEALSKTSMTVTISWAVMEAIE